MPPVRVALATLVVDDYDAALAFYVDVLGFDLVEDTALGPAKRWVVVRPPGTTETGLLLARAADEPQAAAVGHQTGGRVAFFLETDDLLADHARLTAADVRFTDGPREEPYGRVAVFEDLHGTRWDLIERRQASRSEGAARSPAAR